MIQALEISKPHLWLLDFIGAEKYIENCKSLLSKDEQDRAVKFRFLKDHVAFVVTRASLRFLIGQYLCINPKEISFSYGNYGKPEINLPGASLEFNVSHTLGLGIIGFSSKVQIGVDIEHIKFDDELRNVASRYFAENEVIELNTLSDRDYAQGFFNCWTRKESFIKAIGDGLSFPLKDFEVTLRPGQEAKLKATHFNSSEFSKWSVEDVPVDTGYVAAFATPMKINSYLINRFSVCDIHT